MIKYNNSNINDWNFGEDNIIKVYRNNAVCYYKVTSGDTPVQEPCFAVVDDITQYSDTEFEDVFNKADGKWYKLNNLNNYEEYGVYGTGRTITYYDGKLTIDDGYEYLYSGNTWNNMGAVSGSSRLPQGYTEVEYIENQYMAYIDTGFKPNQDTRMYMNMQMVTSTSGGRYISAGGAWNSTNTIAFDYESNTLHVKYAMVGGWTTYNSVTMDYDPHEYDFNKNEFYVDGTLVGSTSYTAFQCSYNLAIFAFLNSGNQGNDGEQFLGKMYWFKLYDDDTLIRDFVPCKRDSDSKYGAYDLVNDVFYPSANQGSAFVGGSETSGGTAYPVYYDEIQDPPDNVTFTSMTQAQSYVCPYWGMTGIIANTDYLFCTTNTWLTKYNYEEVTGDYICDGGDKYKKMQEYDRNVDGTISATTTYVKGDLIESGSTDCEQQFDGKWIGYYSDGTAYSADCDTYNTQITKSDVRSGNYQQYKKVIIGDCVTSVSEAFQQCTAMTDLEIGTGVTGNLYYAFEDCTALTAVTWYATSVSDNNDGGFQRCSSLQKLVMYATTAPTTSGTFFNGVPRGLVIYVPDSAISSYQNTYGWSSYTIKGHSELPT